MQRVGTAGRKRLNKLLWLVISLTCLVLLVVVDQVTKVCFKNLYEESGKTTVIDGFFSFFYTENTGAAFSFLANVSWGQAFFIGLTVIALILFFIFYLYICRKN